MLSINSNLGVCRSLYEAGRVWGVLYQTNICDVVDGIFIYYYYAVRLGLDITDVRENSVVNL